MRLAAIAHMGVPVHNAGAEHYLHAMFRDFATRGDHCAVLYPRAETYALDGVMYEPLPATFAKTCAWVDLNQIDVLVTHLDMTGVAMAVAKKTGRPLVHLVHNDAQLGRHGVTPESAQLVVFNSEWIAAKYHAWPGAKVVARPHVRVADYAMPTSSPGTVDDRQMVTLINCTREKGSRTLAAMAQAEPDRRFLAVGGAYGRPDVNIFRRIPNVEVIPTTANITADVYARTRVLLMPSGYESWGRTAIEAACSGIPTIAAPTPGLREALGGAGVLVSLTEPRAWTDALRALDGPDAYCVYSESAYERAVELERVTGDDLDRLHDAVGSLPRAPQHGPSTPPPGLPGPTPGVSARIAVLIPFRIDAPGGARDLAVGWNRERWRTLHPGWVTAIGGDLHREAPWSKGAAVYELRVGEPDANVLVVVDADVYLNTSDEQALIDAVDACAAGTPGVMPFAYVRRWNEHATASILAGRPPQQTQVEMAPRRGVPGGGLTVIRAEVYDECPMDPRFTGWANEDVCWGNALTTLYGKCPAQPNVFLNHLWHPTARRRTPGTQENATLSERYGAAFGDWAAMSDLVAEARATLRA